MRSRLHSGQLSRGIDIPHVTLTSRKFNFRSLARPLESSSTNATEGSANPDPRASIYTRQTMNRNPETASCPQPRATSSHARAWIEIKPAV
ncbi:hypothetical protein BD626DRAFT_475679 [Schizophyllum amplum]|uniref:Uncharacterized protein n=1 Tax=Schizophyllum amplum TaxID=97359 RepID=A0A550CYL7_9AGAR|nr:hypothetical protein BD626DRAFT_475679 [Auriculariopsis ampla]